MAREKSDAPIELMHCIGTMRLGGAEKQLAELITRLPRERFRQSLVLLQGGGPLIGRVRDSGCEVIELGYAMRYRWFNPRSYLAMARTLVRYVRFIRKRRPEILHAQLYWANVLSVAAGVLAGVPVIITSRLQLSHYKAGRPLLQRIENFANRFTTAVFANSGAVRSDALLHEKIDAARIRVIHNGIIPEDYTDTDRAGAKRELGIASDDPVILTVANLHPYKGHADLLSAFAALRADHPSARLLLAGRDQGEEANLRRIITEGNFGDRVRLLGERKDIPQLLAACDVLVHPSHEEGFSNSILEGMIAGRAVVATRVGGGPEAVEDGVTGRLVEPGDPAALADAISPLLADPALRARMGDAGRARALDRFSMDRMIEEFVRWYQSLASEARP